MPATLLLAAVAFAAIALGSIGLYIVDQAMGRGGRWARGQRSAVAVGVVVVALCVGGLVVAAGQLL